MVMISAVASSAAKPLVGDIFASLTPIALQSARNQQKYSAEGHKLVAKAKH